MSTPINEQTYLKRNALACVVLGALYIADAIYNHLTSSVGLKYLTFGLFVASIIFIALVLQSLSKVSKRVFLFSNFEDEYLNHIHNTGYKYAFSLIATFLVLVSITTNIFPHLSEWLLVREFSKFSAGLMFISYSLPILYLLRADDE